jgi:hypothetical protein
MPLFESSPLYAARIPRQSASVSMSRALAFDGTTMTLR